MNQKRLGAVFEWLVVLVVSVCTAVGYGFNYGVDNQVVYLLGALKATTPGILDGDWFTTQVTHYHLAYRWLCTVLLSLTPSGWSVAAALTGVVTVAGLLLYWALRLVTPRRGALLAFFGLMSIVHFTRTTSAGASYFFDFIFQPSTVASLGFVLAIPAFLEGRYWLSGAAVACGGAFHANLLMLSLPAFGLAQMFLGREQLVRRLLQQLALPLGVLLFFVPTILATAGDPFAKQAQELFFHVRAPYHYHLASFWYGFTPLLAWSVLVAPLAGVVAQGSRTGARLMALTLGVVSFVWLSVLLSLATGLPQVQMLFPWRLTPLAELLLQLCVCAGTVKAALTPGGIATLKPAHWSGVLLAGTSGLALYYGRGSAHLGNTVFWPVLCLGLLPLVSLASRADFRAVHWLALRCAQLPFWILQAALWGAGALIWFAHEPIGLEELQRRSTLLREDTSGQSKLYAWIREHTPKDSVFLTPPYHEAFRFHTQRAIVVDWKASPVVPAEVMQWYERINHVSGTKALRSYRELSGYDAMTPARLAELQQRYRLDYAIVRANVAGRFTQHKVVYRSPAFVVLKLQ